MAQPTVKEAIEQVFDMMKPAIFDRLDASLGDMAKRVNIMEQRVVAWQSEKSQICHELRKLADRVQGLK